VGDRRRTTIGAVARALEPERWAGTQNNLGIALWEQGLRSPGEAGQRLLARALEAYQAVLSIYPESEEAQQRLEIIYHEGPFEYDQASR
jgi:predicted GNAT family N-acyltransferase